MKMSPAERNHLLSLAGVDWWTEFFLCIAQAVGWALFALLVALPTVLWGYSQPRPLRFVAMIPGLLVIWGEYKTMRRLHRLPDLPSTKSRRILPPAQRITATATARILPGS
jgi:hypothetical protein